MRVGVRVKGERWLTDLFAGIAQECDLGFPVADLHRLRAKRLAHQMHVAIGQADGNVFVRDAVEFGYIHPQQINAKFQPCRAAGFGITAIFRQAAILVFALDAAGRKSTGLFRQW